MTGEPPWAGLLARPAWHADAACREHPELDWVPNRDTACAGHREVCEGCLVGVECLTWALEQGVGLLGVWAGTTAADRRRLRARSA